MYGQVTIISYLVFIIVLDSTVVVTFLLLPIILTCFAVRTCQFCF